MRAWTLTTLLMAGLTAATLTAGDPQGTQFSDRDFIAKAAGGSQFEVRSSQLALQKSASTDLKSFAQQMVNDHTKANQELATLMTRKGWGAPPAMDAQQVETLNRLGKLQSFDFDRAYGEVQLKAHEQTVALFEQAAKDCQDADLKAWATKTLPTLREHLQMAQRIFKKIGTK